MNKDNKEKIPLYSYSEKELEKVSSYIERQYGEYEDVIHEIVSPDIHCDIVLVPPTDSSPYYKLVTMGAGAYKMNIPKEYKSMICDRLNMSSSCLRTGMSTQTMKKTGGP